MSLPSSPSHNDTATLNGNDYQFDSDLQAWLLKRTATDKALSSSLDSDIIFVRSLFSKGAQSAGFPVGSIIPFALSNLPKGFLLTDGSTFNPLIYPDLYEYLGSDELPLYNDRSLYYKEVDFSFGQDFLDSDFTVKTYDEVVFGIAAYNGAGLATDSEVIATIVEQQVSDLQSEINILKADRDSDSLVIQTLRQDLDQAISDRVFTDNTLSARIDGHDSEISTKGRFYVQPTRPSGGHNSGWVNTTTMKLHVFDVTTDTWIEVTLT